MKRKTGKSHRDYNRASFWIGVVALIVSVFLTYLTLQSDWRIATESGAFSRPQVQFGLGGFALAPAVTTRVIVGASYLSGDNRVVITGLPFSLVNSGDRTLDETTVTFRFHDMFRRDALEALEYTPVGNVQATRVERSFSQAGLLHYSSYLIPALHPGQTMVVNEPFYLPETRLDMRVDAETADRVPITADLTVEFAIQFQVTLAARDLLSRDYNLTLETAPAESLDDLQRRAASARINSRMREARRRATFGQYLRALVFGAPPEEVYLVFAELDEHATEVGSLSFGHDNPRVRQLTYRPVAWRLLFQ